MGRQCEKRRKTKELGGVIHLDSIVYPIINFLSENNIPRELIVFIISLFPILELRGGILAAMVLKLDWPVAFMICVVGNLLPIPFILLFIKRIFLWLKNTRFVKLVHKLEEKAQKKSAQVSKFKMLGLFLFVAIPLPGTGAWTGALIAAMMDMRIKQALPFIILGVLTAGLIMTLLSYGVLGNLFG
ncbi:MAG: small multi-drug export protein [Clostridiales bacterium]|nr:small multi-drug export protein [Clostridiales bacterium]